MGRGSIHRRIASAAAIIAIITFSARLLGAVREMFVARQFGGRPFSTTMLASAALFAATAAVVAVARSETA